MGAIPFDGGVTFRLWAPNATAVDVLVARGGETGVATPMAAEVGGIWSVDVSQAGAGDTYQYVLSTPTGRLTRVDPHARVSLDTGAARDATAAVVYDPRSFEWGTQAWNSPGWSELVIYELHVGSFNLQPEKSVGTFDDVIAKLPYLQALGINAIELLPVAGFEGDISWGYDPGVPYSVARGYGGTDGLKRLVALAHEAGIAVLLDVVFNHLGPPDSILWQFDGSGPGWEGGVYFYGSRFAGDARPQTPWGSRPDYGRGEVRQYLRDNALMWLEDCRVDGLRFDATAYIRSVDGSGSAEQAIHDGCLLLQEINDDVDATQEWKLIIAEDMRGAQAITAPTATGGAGFDAQWDPDFVVGLRAALEAVFDDQRSIATVAGLLQRRLGAPVTGRVVFTESHDADGNGRTRVPAEINPLQPDSWWSKKRSTLGAAIVLTAPGIPMLFQGQEFLEQQPFVQSPPALDWTNAATFAGILDLYRDLIRLRRDWADCTRGLRGDGINVFHINDTDKLIAYHRFDLGGPGDDVVIVANFANRGFDSYVIGLPATGAWHVRFNGDWTGYDASFGGWPSYDVETKAIPQDGLACSAGVSVGPYTAIVLSQGGSGA